MPTKRVTGSSRPTRKAGGRLDAMADASPDSSVLLDLVDASARSDVMLGFLIHDLARTRRRASDLFMKSFGLSRTQWYVLARLSVNDGMAQTVLADEIEIGKANLGIVIEGLESAGWVERQESPSDMRVKRVFLTRQAVQLMKRMFRSEVDFNNRTMADLSRKERDVMFKLLGKVRNGVEALQLAFDERGRT